MSRKWFRFIVLGVVFVSLCFIVTTPNIAFAQADDVYMVTFGDDATGGDILWENYDLLATNGSDGGFIEFSGGTFRVHDTAVAPLQASARIILPPGCLLTDWAMNYYMSAVHTMSWYTQESPGGAWTHQSDFVGTSGSEFTWGVGSLSLSPYAITIHHPSHATAGAFIFGVGFTCEEGSVIGGGGVFEAGPFQPIRIDDQIEYFHGEAESGAILSASRISATFDASLDAIHEVPVYASHSGTIDKVYERGGVYFVEYLEDDDNGLELVITYDNLSDVFVAPGDHVDAGCIIGIAGPPFANIETDEPEIRQIIYGAIDTGLTDDYDNWTLYSDPSGNMGCGSNQTTEHCFNSDPRFSSPKLFWGQGRLDDWPSAFGGIISMQDGSVTIPPGSYIHQELRISGTPDPVRVTIVASIPNTSINDGQIRVSIGDATEDLYVSYDGGDRGSQRVVMTGELTPTEPDFDPDVYSLSIANISGVGRDIRLYFVCMAMPDDEVIAPDACYFNADGYFRDQEDGNPANDWTLSEDAFIYPTFFGGSFPGNGRHRLILPLDEDASYTLNLPAFEDKPTDYILDLRAFIGEINILPPNGETLNISIDSTALTDPDTDIIIRSIALSESTSLRFTLPTDTPIVDGTLTLTHSDTVEVDPENPPQLSIPYACLYPADGVWPGHEDADWMPLPGGIDNFGGIDNPGGIDDGCDGPCSGSASYMPPQCGSSPEPPSSLLDIGGWLLWLGQLIDWVFECKFYPLFTQGIARLMGFVWWIGMLGRWFKATFESGASWLMSLNTYAINTAIGLLAGFIEEVWSALVSLELLQGLFDQVSLAGIVIALLIDLIATLTAMVLNIVRIIGTLAQFVFIIWTYILAGINGTSVVDTGIPSCTGIAGDNVFYPFCAFFDLTDYTFDLFPGFWAIVAVLCSIVIVKTFDLTRAWLSETFREVS